MVSKSDLIDRNIKFFRNNSGKLIKLLLRNFRSSRKNPDEFSSSHIEIHSGVDYRERLIVSINYQVVSVEELAYPAFREADQESERIRGRGGFPNSSGLFPLGSLFGILNSD